ncbi:septum formation initiator family protein [Zhihengliuella sp.]|uniref:FtsB family cell division protein n=1 Tax=Zhihengliuella sp. TaxID=1954483 RepID=UPI0028123871|nr:septum formation initiator family protein [Zhihengliuella sp.]
MTTRRPRMPRAGNGAPRPPRPAEAAGNDDAQRQRDRADRPQGHPAAGPAGRGGSAQAPQASQPGATRPGASQPRAPRSTGSPEVLRLPKSEARLKQRAELSGAIRSGRPGPADRGGTAAAETGSPEAAPVPARSFSGRLIALAVVLAAVTALLLPSAGVYMEQRKELTALQETIASLEAEQEHLETQVKRWEDPAYIRQQARERINLVMPGERKYMVVGEPPEAAGEPLPENASPSEVPADLPWVDALWDSVKRAATD